MSNLYSVFGLLLNADFFFYMFIVEDFIRILTVEALFVADKDGFLY